MTQEVTVEESTSEPDAEIIEDPLNYARSEVEEEQDPLAYPMQPSVPLVSRVRPQDYVLLLSSCEKWIIIFINSSCWNAHSIDDIIYRLSNSQYNAMANIGVIDGVADKDYFSKLGFEKQTIQIRDPPCSNFYGATLHPLYLQTVASSLQTVLSSHEEVLCQKKGGRQISDSCYFHVVFSRASEQGETKDCYNYYKELKHHFKGLYKFSIDPTMSTQSACHVTVYGVDKDSPFVFDLDAPPGGPVMSIYTLSSFLRDYRASFEPCAITPDKINLSPYSGVTGSPSFSNQPSNCYLLKQLLGYPVSYPDSLCDQIAAQFNGGQNLNPAPSVVNYYSLNPSPLYPRLLQPFYPNLYIDGGPYQLQYPLQAPYLPGFYPSEGNQIGQPLGQEQQFYPQQQQPVQQFAQPEQLLQDPVEAFLQPVLLPQQPNNVLENSQIAILEQPNVGSRSFALPDEVSLDVKSLKDKDLEKLFENPTTAANHSDLPEGSRSAATPTPDLETTENNATVKAVVQESESPPAVSDDDAAVSSSSDPEPVIEKPASPEVVATSTAGVTDLALTDPPTPPPVTVIGDPAAQDDILAIDLETVIKDCKFWIILGTTDDDKRNKECSQKLSSIKPKYQKNYKFGGIYSKEFSIQLFLKNKSNPITVTKNDACDLDEISKILEDHKNEHPGEFCQDDDVYHGERSIEDPQVNTTYGEHIPDPNATTPQQPNSSYSYEFVETDPELEPLPASSTKKPLEIEIIYVDSLTDNTTDVTSADTGVLNTMSYPSLFPRGSSIENRTPRTFLHKILDLTNTTTRSATLPSTDVTSPAYLPDQTTETVKSLTVKRSWSPKVELHKDCKYQIILRSPEPESAAIQDCENALSTLVTSHDWALMVEPRDTFGIFLGSAGGVRDIKIPSVEYCSIENVQKGVDELLKDPINKPLCVYVRSASRG